MSRLVLHEAQGPAKVGDGENAKWICMCGLSGNKPFCDGSHKKTKDEEAGKLYSYHADGTRTEVK